MISSDLTRNIKTSLKTVEGQLRYILRQIDQEHEAANILLQLKASQALLNKITFELLDETYRKALAENIASAYRNCPGNCGNEEVIEKLRKMFPELLPEEIPQKLLEARQIEQKVRKFLMQQNLDTPRTPN